jgi:hypothetical protein
VLLTLLASALLAPAPKQPPPPKWADFKELKFPDQKTCEEQYRIWRNRPREFYPKGKDGRPVHPDPDGPWRPERYAQYYWDQLQVIWQGAPHVTQQTRDSTAKKWHAFLGEKAYRAGWHPPIWDGTKAIPQFEIPNRKYFLDRPTQFPDFK